MTEKIKSTLRAIRAIGGGGLVSGISYGIQKALLDRRYTPRKPHGAFQRLGGVIAVEKHERGIIVNCGQGTIRLTVIAPDCIQVRFQQSGKFPVPFSYAVAKVTWAEVPFRVQETDETFTLSTAELSCVIERTTGELTFKNAQNRVISHDIMSWREHEVCVTRDLPEAEHAFGLASQPVGLNLKGHRYPLWNTDPVNYDRGRLPIYYTIPFYLGVNKDWVYGIFWDNSSRGYADIGAEQNDKMAFCSESGELRYYVFAGLDVNSVLNRYTELTGRPTMQPMWAFGFHLSRWSYYPADRVREVATLMRRHKLPCDALYLDIHYMDGYRVFTWDRERFPAPALLINELAEQGYKTVAIVDPGIKVDPRYKTYESGMAEQVFLKLPNDKLFTGPVWAGKSVFPDFTSPKVRAWWAAQFDTLIRPGVAGIWNDMNEPTVFNVGFEHEIPSYVRHDFEGQGATHLEAHNVYGMLMGRASKEALEKMRPGKRPFNIVRSAYAGAQRYASTWTGDNKSTWDHLKLNISMVMNSGLSGMVFNGADIGGFAGDCEPELFTRWIQLGSMMPFFRVHSAEGTAAQEPYIYGQPYEDIIRRYINLRYQLLPYLYSVYAQSHQYGWPMIRPMFMADHLDMSLYDIEDQFMVGESLLVAPVVEKGKTSREVYLPRGKWYNFHTSQPMQGGQSVTVQAGLDTMPIFVRAGQVIPLWPVQQYIGQVPIEELMLKVYAGTGEVTLYEDAGENLDYQNGTYRWLYFTCKMIPEGFSIDWRRAGRYNPPYERVRCEVHGIQFEPKEVQLDGAAAPLWYYEKGVVEFTATKPFDNARVFDQTSVDSTATLMRSPLKDK